ncbi:hypothetical protein ScPMuIL_015121 [Solemya velum]
MNDTIGDDTKPIEEKSGCLFTEQLCGSAEDCIDDLLFGNCQLSNSPHDYYQYRLSPKALEVLEYEIRRLIQKGVSWHNAYTQCILQNILLAYRQEQLFDESKCSDSLSYTTSDLNNEISSVLHNVLDSYENYEPEKVYFENAEPNYFLDDFSKSTKRDEIVQVHKYFDKSKGLHKRKLASPNLSQKLYNYLLFGQQENSRQRDIQQESDTDVSLEDIQTLQYYLQQLKSPRFSTDLAVNNDDLLTDTYPGPEPSDIQAPFPTRTSDQWTLDFQPGYLWTDESQAKQPVNEFSKDVSESNPVLDQSASEMEPLEGVVESSADEAIPELPSLPPPYANLLGKLLEGEIEAENLTDEQLEYITNYINSVLVQLGFSQNELTQLEQEYLARNNEKSENNSEFEEEIDGTNRNIVNEVSSSRSLDIQDDFKEPVIAEHEEEPLISEKKSGTNPLNKYGKCTTCAVCRSVYHWAKRCPDNPRPEAVKMTECQGNDNTTQHEAVTESCNIILFTKESPSTNEILVMESLGVAVIDTACTKTVCGENWLRSYEEALNSDQKQKVTKSQSDKRFRFGDGNVVTSRQKVTIPAKIWKMKCNIEAEVVKADIPLLLSKESLKRAETVLDLSNDSATMFKQPCRLRHAKPILGDVSISEKTDSNNIGDSDTVNIDTLLQRDVDNQNSVDRDAVAESDSSDDDGVRDLGEQAQARAETDQQTVIVLKPGQSVQYLDRDSCDIVVGRILGRAGKATGRNKNWYNLEFVQPELKAGEKGSVDLSRVDDLETTIDSEDVAREQDESVMKLEGVSFDDAKCGELNSWKKNRVYIEIPDMGQKCISTRWICTLRETDIGIVPKARLVARGFEELYTSDIQRDSPTCTKESLKMILAVIAQNGWKPCSMDIKTAFLQGHELERDIFIRPPKEADSPGIIWRLKKCVYGLVDASLYWYNRVKSVMLDLGANISRVDPAVFYWIDSDNQVIGILASHVDDFIWSGTPYFEESVINKVRSTFCVGKENSVAFQYIGMDLSCEKDEILLHQDQYVENIAPINIEKNRALQRESYLDDSEKHSLRSKIGQLLWVAHQSRPDIVFDACCLANRVKNAQVQDILDTNKVVRRLKSETVNLKFQHVGVQEKLKLVLFNDASLGNLPDGGTQGGHFIVLMGPDGLFSPICWQSKRIRRVVRSTLAGETLALADGVDNCIFLSTLYMELTKGVSQPSEVLPITCVVDNHSLYDAIKSTKFVADKRLRLEISNIKELLKTNKSEKYVGQIPKSNLLTASQRKVPHRLTY